METEYKSTKPQLFFSIHYNTFLSAGIGWSYKCCMIIIYASRIATTNFLYSATLESKLIILKAIKGIKVVYHWWRLHPKEFKNYMHLWMALYWSIETYYWKLCQNCRNWLSWYEVPKEELGNRQPDVSPLLYVLLFFKNKQVLEGQKYNRT